MSSVFAGLAVLVLSGCAALFFGRSQSGASRIGSCGVVIGCSLVAISVVSTFAGAAPADFTVAWSMPGGCFWLGLDGLSAVCLLPILILGALGAVYAPAYLKREAEGKGLGPHWLFYNLLIASMIIVVLARNGLLFLLAWEGMALSSYFLVNFDSEREEVRRAGLTYLVATHLGTAFLLVLFTALGARAGSLDFSHWNGPVAHGGLLFVLALIGFGSKAGIVPVHVWLPEAHPSAPSHVSALMSGAMLKTGIYGLLRFLTFLGQPEPWWGILLIAVGLASGILGVLFALAQHDLKRLLAYHSVENIGIICLGVGLGLLGLATGHVALAVLGFAGALLHIVNHALFKGLLFLGAGSVLYATGTREIDHLGGLLRRMPWTGFCFLIGSAAISALPALNGFVSEFLIYLGAFDGIRSARPSVIIASCVSIALLGLIGGLAAACFTKAFGTVFLGEPRSAYAHGVVEVTWSMRIPMLLLSLACFGIGLAPAWAAGLLLPAIRDLSGLQLTVINAVFLPTSSLLVHLSWVGLSLFALGGAVAFLRAGLLHGRPVSHGPTWDCGYAAPTPRMQYTASSFAQPIVDLMAPLLRTVRSEALPTSLFPTAAHFESETPDLFRRFFFDPIFNSVRWLARQLRVLQTGSGHMYVLYLVLTLVVLLFWGLRP